MLTNKSKKVIFIIINSYIINVHNSKKVRIFYIIKIKYLKIDKKS